MQSIPLAVLKLHIEIDPEIELELHAIHTACGIFFIFSAFFQTRAFFMA